eukprot:14584043-Alexandrium_andersonii.AAC.1
MAGWHRPPPLAQRQRAYRPRAGVSHMHLDGVCQSGSHLGGSTIAPCLLRAGWCACHPWPHRAAPAGTMAWVASPARG